MEQSPTPSRERTTPPEQRMIRADTAAAEQLAEQLPSAERRRRAEILHISNLSAHIEEQLGQQLAMRDLESDSNGRETMTVLSALREGNLLSREPVGEPGMNLTEACVIQRPDGGRMLAYLKPQHGEMAVTDLEGVLCRVQQHLDDQGVLVTEYPPYDGYNQVAFERRVQQRRFFHARFLDELADHYQVPPEHIRLNPAEFGMRKIDTGHAVKAEYAAGIIDQCTGFGVIPRTGLRHQDQALSSVQEHAAGQPATYADMRRIFEEGPGHPAAKSFMRLACMDYLIGTTDRHPNNLLYDAERQQFNGIDNGFSNGYSHKEMIPQSDGSMREESVPADPYYSIPMEGVDQHENWFLDEEAVARLQDIHDQVVQYAAFIDGRLDSQTAGRLPEHVKEGRMAKMLEQVFRLLHEYPNEDGEMNTSSTKIARKELDGFLQRVQTLITLRRPPKLPDEVFRRRGIMQYV